MKIFISNFARRVADLLQQNRARLIKWLLIAVAALIALLLISAGVERLQRTRYERRVQALESQFREADAKAKDLEVQASAMAAAIEVKQAELRDMEARAASAESALRTTRTIILPLKETYEQARNNPDIPADTSCADACRELAGLGHPCR